MSQYIPTGGYTVGKYLGNGFPGNVSRDRDAIIIARAVNAGDVNSIPFGSPAILNVDNTYSLWTTADTTLGAALTSGSTYTSLTVSALKNPARAGSNVVIGQGSSTNQSVTLSADAAIGATTLQVDSFTANAAYASGVNVAIENTASQVAGIAIREVKQATDYMANPGTPGAEYAPGQIADLMERGSITVVCQRGTPGAGSAVYLRTETNSAYPNAVIGGFEASSDGSNTVKLSNMLWKTGNMDVNNVAELTILTRQLP